jgi:hypothetical protein
VGVHRSLDLEVVALRIIPFLRLEATELAVGVTMAKGYIAVIEW